VKTVGKEPLILEQPLYITVEEPKEMLQAIATAPPPANAPASTTAPANGTK
jgi:hypothetical protein